MATKHDGILIGPKPAPDEPRRAFQLVCADGVWRVHPVVTLDRPDGGWYRTGFTYRLSEGKADGDDLFLREDHAAAEVIRRNMRSGGWDGKR
jgi:hypothetical protein